MESIFKDDLAFFITLDDLQKEAMNYTSRILTPEEISIAKKGLEFGLCTDIDTVYKTIFKEMIQQ